MKKEKAVSVTAPRVCAICPFRKGCPRLNNPSGLGYCQEGTVYVLLAALLYIEIKLLF